MLNFHKTDAIAHKCLEARNPAAFLARVWPDLTAAEGAAVLAQIKECEERARMMMDRADEQATWASE